jgi:hypothetical protein
VTVDAPEILIAITEPFDFGSLLEGLLVSFELDERQEGFTKPR